jgi:putative endonuclease
MQRYFVYIVANANRTIYVGVTSNLQQRVQQHRAKTFAGFTAKYAVSGLVYFQEFGDARDAIEREKQIKGYRRAKKIALIEAQNPQWEDLAADWFS